MIDIITNLIVAEEINGSLGENRCLFFGSNFVLRIQGAGNTALLDFSYETERLQLQVPIKEITHLLNRAIRNNDIEVYDFLKNCTYKKSQFQFRVTSGQCTIATPRKDMIEPLDVYQLSYLKNGENKYLEIPAWEIKGFKYLDTFVAVKDYDNPQEQLKQQHLKKLFKPYLEKLQLAMLDATPAKLQKL